MIIAYSLCSPIDRAEPLAAVNEEAEAHHGRRNIQVDAATTAIRFPSQMQNIKYNVSSSVVHKLNSRPKPRARRT